MTNHPNRNRRATLARKAQRLGFALERDNSWQSSDDGMFQSRWRLSEMAGNQRSPYYRASSWFRTLAEVDQRLDYEQIKADLLP
jgi:hypothetical protein